MGVYIYDTMEKVPFEILNIIGLKTWKCSFGEFAFAYWYLKAYYVNLISTYVFIIMLLGNYTAFFL